MSEFNWCLNMRERERDPIEIIIPCTMHQSAESVPITQLTPSSTRERERERAYFKMDDEEKDGSERRFSLIMREREIVRRE